MKNNILATLLMLVCTYLHAQSFEINDLSASVGNWNGTLTYLDYSTAQPYSMAANIKIRLTANKQGYIMAYEYPKEPHANSVDTTYVTGNLFGKEKIVEFNKTSESGFTLVTEIAGEDGNEHKKALLRHTYKLNKNTFSVVKEVQFIGTEKWIKRNEYLLQKAAK